MKGNANISEKELDTCYRVRWPNLSIW